MKEKGAETMDFLHLAKTRYAVRSYQNKPVESEKIAKILEAGRIAPTAANRQPQKVLVVQSDAGRKKLEKAANTFQAPLVFIICADHSQVWKRSYDGKSATDIDASIVTDHMMLEATELGLGSLWICAFQPDILKKEFLIPEGLEPINLLAVGYANGAPASPDRHDTTRKALAETVVYESF